MKKTLLIVAVILFGSCMSGQAGGTGKKSLLLPPKENTSLTFKNAGLSLGEDDDSYTDLMKKKKKKRKKGRGKKGGGGEAFEQGNVLITLGYGVPNLTKSVYKAYKSYTGYKVSGLGPLHFKFEYALGDKIGLGLNVNYVTTKVEFTETSFSDDTTYSAGFDFNAIAFNVRGNFHFVRTDKLDVYTGLGLGYNKSESKYHSDDPYAMELKIGSLIPLGLEFGIGMRYYFTPNIGGYFEFGPAKSIIQGGLAIKF